MERTSRYERHPELVPFRFNPDEDPKIIKTVYDYRFISSEQAQAVIERSNQMILRRLQKLFHHNYLDRMDRQLNAKKNIKMIYALGDRGADVLAEYYDIQKGKIDWQKKNSEVKRGHILHTLSSSDFRACLTVALRKVSGAEIPFWQRENPKTLKDVIIITKNGKRQRWPVVPDNFFQIFYAGWKYPRCDFFHEADRSTMIHDNFLKKMRAYWIMWRETYLGRHRNSFEVKNFRVLTTTKSRQRRDNLIEVTRKADDDKTGSYMFWFACEQDFDLQDPLTILHRIWRTPADQELHSILE